jgi:hypothetical protein
MSFAPYAGSVAYTPVSACAKAFGFLFSDIAVA